MTVEKGNKLDNGQLDSYSSPNLHLVFCNGPDLKDFFSKLSEGMGSVGVSRPRVSGLLLKWVQDSVFKASFLQLFTALPASGLRQLPPVLFPLKAWTVWLGNPWAPRWCPRAACSSYPEVGLDSGLAG